jgi:hypothetical protein
MPMFRAWKPGQGNELEFVAHGPQFPLEGRDGGVVQVGFPVERRGAVVGQQLVGKLLMNALGKAPGLIHVRLGGFTPDHVRIRGVGQAPGDGGFHAVFYVEKALRWSGAGRG